MANTVSSANMNLPVPVVGVDPGPTYASDLNSCLGILDSHTHAAGSGVAITPSGLNINSDLSMLNNNLTTARSLRMTPQSAVLNGASDLGCLNVVGVDLYFNDVSGNKIQITQSGGIAGSPGSISNLTSPASASYVAGSLKFVWQSAASTSAIMDAGSYIMRNATASSFGMTINPPAAMAANFAITFPALPSSQKIMTMDNTGAIAAPYTVDNSTIAITTNVIAVKALGISSSELASNAVTTGKIATGVVTQAKYAIRGGYSANVTVGQVMKSVTCGNYSTNSTSFTNVTNLAGTIDVLGNPILLQLLPDGNGTNPSFFSYLGGGVSAVSVRFTRDGTEICRWTFVETTGIQQSFPVSGLTFLDVPAAGTYTYRMQVGWLTGTGSVGIGFSQLYAYEIA